MALKLWLSAEAFVALTTHLVNFYFEEELGNYKGNLGSLGLFWSYKVLKLTFLHLNYF
jgi:hypothetical protein